MKASNAGFTLIEALVAMAISAVVALGVYALFSSTISTKEATEKSNQQNMLLISAKKTFKNDLLQMFENTLTLNTAGDNSEVSLTTHNSIKLEKAVPVTVTYYVEDGWLMRKEEQTDLNYEWTLKLLPDVTEFKVLSFDGEEFVENYKKSDKIIQISFKYGNEKIQFIAGCGFSSKASDSFLGGHGLTSGDTTIPTQVQNNDDDE